MLKFFWGKGSQQSAERLKIQKDLFQFRKTVQHGFPSKPSAIAWDPVLRLLCIGNKTGAIKIFGDVGVEFYGQCEKDINICNLYFIPGQGRVISLSDENSLHLWEIVTSDTGVPCLKCVKSQSLQGLLKKISACWVEEGGQNFLIGTENGNIYVMDLCKFEVSETVIYLDVVMQNVTEDFKVNPGAVETISQQPGDPDRILIGYTRGLLVLWNRKSLSADQTFVASQQLESASWHASGKKFTSSHNDGSYIIWNVNVTEEEGPAPDVAAVKSDPSATTPYGPFPCKAINKILWSGNGEDEEGVIAFGGGMPRANYGDRFTVSVVRGDKEHVAFDLTSKVVDFLLIEEAQSRTAEALVVLAEEELIVIDLISAGWPSFASPYLVSLHCSAITAQTTVSVTAELYDRIKTHPQMLPSSSKTSTRPWPINGGVSNAPPAQPSDKKLLLLTGHEDGSVRIWDASSAALHQIGKFSTASCFMGDDFDLPPDDEEAEVDEDEWPPFRKAGVFDPYSDDPRLAVKKLCLCPVTGLLTVAGTAGQVVVAEFSDKAIEREIPVSVVNIVCDRDSFVWKGHDKLPTRKGSIPFKAGFQPTCILQLHPPAAATALALHAEWSVLAVGTAHGLAVFDTVRHKEVASKCTLNPNDLSGVGDAPMSRRKSFKKSLRESFRRLRKGRSQRAATTPKSNPASPLNKAQEPSTQATSASGPSTSAEVRPVERQIEARIADDGMGSMVRCILFVRTYITNHSPHPTPTLWAGTNSGAICVFNLAIPSADKRDAEAVNAQLAKEIQLKHRAPVVAINIIDSNCTSLGDSATKKASADEALPHRVVISSEEQFKVFTLPTLRPFGKYKLTAYTGCQVRRVAIIPFTSRSDSTYKENCLVCLSNQGEFHILSLPDLRRQMNAQAIRKEDIHATSTVVLTQQGEAMYMQSSSEIQRVALSASHCLQIKCHVPLLRKKTPADAANNQSATNGDGKGLERVPENGGTNHGTNLMNNGGCEVEKSNGSSEGINSTIVSEGPDASFGDMTMDSIKDHLASPTEESRVIEVKSERIVQESVTVTEVSTVITETHEVALTAAQG